ncbi:L-serine ammonia-lyase [Neolewinella lacunae]|uniref:L-serine dehydratase n=1 Tax=Neolewinella lacunae TaxID=1517758 RepID=A0A923PM69_9BACT|nr:L-serine ammonia-lyase [Neolewinella lacunae]MBC6995999.1 L-serine ammonia-lyase [Neolewinella lacunae]MDN3633173.1 L-serine ammonia-lyase [Neolewinella lacunae]
MPAISVFDIFKIGVGPSSSHTIGPWKAALEFVATLPPLSFDRLEVRLYGSLSKTGRGHATDAAVQLGLLGHVAENIASERIPEYLAELKESGILAINGQFLPFSPQRDIVFTNLNHKSHPNTLEFLAYAGETVVHQATYASLGGGFIRRVGVVPKGKRVKLPFPIDKGTDLLAHVDAADCSIAALVRRNEESLRPRAEVDARLQTLFQTMKEAVYRGCTTGGTLPGGLNVQRRAKAICTELLDARPFADLPSWETRIRGAYQDFNTVNKWVSCFALAVNEENAAMGRIVTGPTNGAAGVVPAVLLYYYFFCTDYDAPNVEDFLLTAGEIGSLFKKGATISAAVGGCQAEIGVSSAMAAGGLTEVLGGSPRQVLMAAEIAMEHHLGLTCDPVGGLVQIPCIERNAMGAIKAITAANLALAGNPADSKVDIDTVIKTMWHTAKAMNHKYKETSLGGLAFNLPVVIPEC